MLPLILAGAAIAGAAGAMKDKSKSTTESWVSLDPASQREIGAGQTMDSMFSQLGGMVNAGPGQADVEAGVGAQRDLASMFQRASQQGGMDPTAEDYGNSNSLASRLFAQQRVGLYQSFEQGMQSANQQASLMGRNANDPVLRAKLLQEQMRQSAQLDAGQNSFATQYAMQQPGQRLQMATQRTNIMSGLATQAMQNRQMIAGMGDSIMQQERNFRLQTARRYGTQTQESGGGLKGALTGAIAGAGAGMSLSTGMGNLMGGSAPTGGSGGTGQLSGMNYGQSPNQFWGMQSMANPFGGA